MEPNEFDLALQAIEDIDRFTEYLGKAFPTEEALVRFLSLLLIPLCRQGFQGPTRAAKLFDIGQSMGIHVLPTHFYSPVPNTAELGNAVWERPLPVAFEDAVMKELIADIAPFASELDQIPEEAAPHVFHWKNPALCPGDAILYYCMLRHLKPRRVLEVGSGYSTLVARLASRRNKFSLECIEPYPFPWLRGVPDELIEKPVQEVPLERFSSLQAGDVLFIDSTHVVKIGSDVVHLFTRVLPLLQPGVVVHVHDIFLPSEYPRAWVDEMHLFWNEQYLLAAFLQGNREWEVLFGNNYASQRFPEALLQVFPKANPPGGASFWMRRRKPLI
jgi:predicted O-methyltransferase YrrM